MFTDLLSTYFILVAWKKNPSLTKRQIGVMHQWKEDTEENNKPLTKDEVEGMKSFLKKYNPTAYYKLFPEEKQ
ncbi:MAG TPA: hypothetical protein P5570_01040 [Candidatus Paceibacterota bacterium]|jgi:hypothetical protein|nr:hypothetical protein [Candidatus Paceibacterota bacterium]